MAETLSEDIVVEILLRLPVKSLMRFKCVCKPWWRVISGPGFSKLHLQRVKSGDMISSQRIFKTSPLETIDYEALDGGIDGVVDHPSWGPYLLGSCDGLVCLFVSSGFLLYNPTTKECRDLPGTELYASFFGLGYDSLSDDYKIIKIGGLEEERQAVVLSLKSGSWRSIQVQQDSYSAISERGVYWNGALNWGAFDDSIINGELVIISFDVSKEKFNQVLEVPEVDEDLGFLGLGIHGANLFIYYGTTGHDRFDAWIINERGGSWTKLFSVFTRGIFTHGISIRNVEIIAYTSSGKIILLIDMFRAAR